MKRTETIRRWERKPGWAGALEVAGSSLFLFYSQKETSAVVINCAPWVVLIPGF